MLPFPIPLARPLLIGWLAAMALLPGHASAETVTLPAGSFDIPDQFQVLEKTDKPDPKTGGSAGIVAFGLRGELPRAIFIVVFDAIDGTAPAEDPLSAAVQIGDPGNGALSAKDAKAVDVGGASGGLYIGTLASGMAVRSYVVANNGYRLTVLLKGPKREPFVGLTQAFAAGLEKFRWAAPRPATPASVGNAPAVAQTAIAPAPDLTATNRMRELLAGDAPISVENLKAYLKLALAAPAAPPGMRKKDDPDDWGGALSRLLFSSNPPIKSLQVWTAAKGGDALSGALRQRGLSIVRFGPGTSFVGHPDPSWAPAVIQEIGDWYAGKLKDSARP